MYVSRNIFAGGLLSAEHTMLATAQATLQSAISVISYHHRSVFMIL